MKLKRPIQAALLFAAGYCTNDALFSFGFRYSMFSEILRTRSVIPYGGLDELRFLADDANATKDRRSAAILSIFANHLNCGMSASDVHAIIGTASWLRESSVTIPMVLTGIIPVQSSGRTVVVIDVLSGNRQTKYFQIWLSLEGDGELGAGGLDFLTNKDSADRFTLVEYALYYPNLHNANLVGRTEHFTRWRFWADPAAM